MGGLARRAAFIADKRKTDDPGTVRLFIAGPYELQDIDENKSPAAKAPQVVGQAYASLEYDAMMITPEDAAVLGQDMPEALKAWAAPVGKVASRSFERKNLRIGLVYFPVLPSGKEQPSADQMEEVVKQARALRADGNVVIGVSPWGFAGEKVFLEKYTGPDQPVDILLGGGHGSGERGKLAADGSTAWLRSFSKGKAVNFVRLENISERHKDSYRKPESEVRFELAVLDESAPIDPLMDGRLAPARAGN